jgi:hypothetical protein
MKARHFFSRTGLAGVRKAAGENKEMKFTAFLHHLTLDLLPIRDKNRMR